VVELAGALLVLLLPPPLLLPPVGVVVLSPPLLIVRGLRSKWKRPRGVEVLGVAAVLLLLTVVVNADSSLTPNDNTGDSLFSEEEGRRMEGGREFEIEFKFKFELEEISNWESRWRR